MCEAQKYIEITCHNTALKFIFIRRFVENNCVCACTT